MGSCVVLTADWCKIIKIIWVYKTVKHLLIFPKTTLNNFLSDVMIMWLFSCFLSKVCVCVCVSAIEMGRAAAIFMWAVAIVTVLVAGLYLTCFNVQNKHAIRRGVCCAPPLCWQTGSEDCSLHELPLRTSLCIRLASAAAHASLAFLTWSDLWSYEAALSWRGVAITTNQNHRFLCNWSDDHDQVTPQCPFCSSCLCDVTTYTYQQLHGAP